MFEIIGHKGSGSTVPNLGNLSYLAVSLNLPAFDPVVSYAVIESTFNFSFRSACWILFSFAAVELIFNCWNYWVLSIDRHLSMSTVL